MVNMTNQESVSIKKAIDDLLQTHIFKELKKTNDPPNRNPIYPSRPPQKVITIKQ